jgi:hypothetical protein
MNFFKEIIKNQNFQDFAGVGRGVIRVFTGYVQT